MISNTTPPSLLDLPTELRVQIYTYLFADFDTDPSSFYYTKIPALLHTSRLPRRESLPIAHPAIRSARKMAEKE